MEYEPVTRQEFVAWRDSDITKMFFQYVIQRIEGIVSDLVTNAGLDQPSDRYKSGKISGLSELADWTPEFRKDDKDEV